MASTIQLNVKVNRATAKADIEAIQAAVKKLEGTPIVLNVDTSGLGKAEKALANAQKAASNAIKEIAKASQEASKTARADQDASIAANNRARAEANKAAALARSADTETNVANATARLTTAENKLAVEQEKTAQTANRLAIEQEKTARATISTGDAAGSASRGFTVLGGAIASALGHLASRAVQLALHKVTQGIREALNEMKDVDTQLTNISKVSGITGQALADMGSRAYDTASQYGVAADEYLAAVYTFQKAGLGPSAEAMGELAVKTMLVGDTTADVASQFLISANAAWEFGGNIDRLNQLVDEADYINNNYATDLAKLSSGLPRVASIAAQAGMSAEETLAALGTITAVTQESGTKAATALRALILNIEGQIGTFVDDTGEEFEVTEESVKSMQGLMEKYAQAELDAAKASGELINPMTAIKAIFEGMANSDLNDQELFQLLSGMGGKLRTNQLTALVKNYELFDEMLGRIANSAGTADKEIELMMSSWERKTQVLKNSWAEFVSNVVDTDLIKGGLDLLTDIVEKGTELVERFNEGEWADANDARAAYESALAEMEALESRSDSLNSVEQRRLEILREITAEYGRQYEEQKLAAAKAVNDELLSNRYSRYTAEGYQTPAPIRMAGDQAYINEITGAYREASSAYTQTGDLGTFQESLRGINTQFQEYYDQLTRVRDAGVELTENQADFITNFDDIQTAANASITSIESAGEGLEGLYDAEGNLVAVVQTRAQLQEDTDQRHAEQVQEQADAIAEFEENVQDFDWAYQAEMAAQQADLEALNDEWGNSGEQLDAVTGAVDALTAAITAAVTEAGGLAPAFQAAASAASSVSIGGGGHAFGTTNAPGGPTLVNELGPELISENGRAYIANGGRPGIVNLSPGAIVLPANVTEQALHSNGVVKTINAAVAGENIYGNAKVAQPSLTAMLSSAVSAGTSAVSTVASWFQSGNGTTRKKGGGGGAGGGGSSAAVKSIEDYAKELKDLLANLDKQAKLADNELDYAKEAELFEKAQEAIKAMVDRYRNAGYSDDSDEILDLLNKNYDYANKQLTLYQTKWDELVKALEADTDAQEAANKLAEKQKAVEDAREALANAQKQRTIRMYNSATGQWEWVADQSKISTAEQKVSTAEEAYSKEVKSQAIAEIKAMRDTVADLDEVVLGPALSAVALMAVNSAEFQNFARALDAVFGVGSYLTSTEGSSNVISTMDSHNITYSFGDVALTEEEANSMSLAEIAKRLSVLKIS